MKKVMSLRKTYYDNHRDNIKEDHDKYTCFTYTNINFRKDAPKNEL